MGPGAILHAQDPDSFQSWYCANIFPSEQREQEEALCQLKQRMPGQIFGQNSLQDVYIVSEYVGRKQHIVLDDMTNMENWKREQP